MLTDTMLGSLKSQDKLYKVNDRDGLYVAVTLAGTSPFAITTQLTAGKRPSPSDAMASAALPRPRLANSWRTPR